MQLRDRTDALESNLQAASHTTLEQEQVINKQYQTLESLQEAVESVKTEKTDLQVQLEEKARIEAEKDAKINNLSQELQAKKEEAQKVAVAISSGGRGSSSGNTYDYGYCTWYVKNRRPDIPNTWGDANTWLARAVADGFSTGSKPVVGAIGTTTAGALGHVVYVQAVNGNGTITISEMNAVGWNVVSSRVASATSFTYIY